MPSSDFQVLCVGGPLDRQIVHVREGVNGEPLPYYRVAGCPVRPVSLNRPEQSVSLEDRFETVEYRLHGLLFGDRVFWFYSSGLSQDQIMTAMIRSYANADFQPERRSRS